MARIYTSFAEFWPFYLREHSKPRTRALHYTGTSLVVLIAAATLLTGRWWWFAALPVAGYFFAWVAHFGVEKNRPATFTYLSLHLTIGFSIAYVMTGSLALAGRIVVVEPGANAVAFFFHEKAWKRVGAGPKLLAS